MLSMATMVPMVSKSNSMLKIIPLAPMASLAPVHSGVIGTNGTIEWCNVSSTFHTRHCILISMTPLKSLVPSALLTPMASMTPMNRHLHQRIANVVNGAINTIGVNDDANDVIDAIDD